MVIGVIGVIGFKGLPACRVYTSTVYKVHRLVGLRVHL